MLRTRLPMGTSYGSLVRMCVISARQKVYRRSHRSEVTSHIWSVRTLGTGDQGENDSSKDSPVWHAQKPHLSAQGPVFRGLGSRHRHLSPLERVSSLLPPETLSQEVWELRGGQPKEQVSMRSHDFCQESLVVGDSQNGRRRRDPEESAKGDCSVGGLMMEGSNSQGEGQGDEGPSVRDSSDSSTATCRELPLQLGDLVLAECRAKGWQEFRKMFMLQEKGHLQSPWGSMAHSTIVGRPSGSVLRLSGGSPILLHRPSLEEYVLLMRRAPAIAYPKDANAILMMMDVTEGDNVLESGSGSGAMTLFLSRAVGSRGSVLSVELRKDHQLCAVRNYQRWLRAWNLRRGEEWPDNVQFHTADLQAAAPLLSGQSFNSVVLDMLNPQLVMPTVFPHLQNGAVCAVYLVNLTQVVDLLEGVRVSGLPLQCERIIEVQHRDWLVAPAILKDGTAATRVAPPAGSNGEEEDRTLEEEEEEESLACEQHAPFGTVTYIVRPHHQQVAHTAFLVKLRKIVPLS